MTCERCRNNDFFPDKIIVMKRDINIIDFRHFMIGRSNFLNGNIDKIITKKTVLILDLVHVGWGIKK